MRTSSLVAGAGNDAPRPEQVQANASCANLAAFGGTGAQLNRLGDGSAYVARRKLSEATSPRIHRAAAFNHVNGSSSSSNAPGRASLLLPSCPACSLLSFLPLV